MGQSDLNLTKALTPSFWAKVNKTKTCWLWTGSVDRRGYGKLGFPKTRRVVSAHRVTAAAFVKDFHHSLFVCHSCDTPNCVNPKHLWMGTNSDNMKDAAKKNRLNTWNKGLLFCKRGHLIEWLVKSTGRRRCRTCFRERDKRYKAKKRAINKLTQTNNIKKRCLDE